MYKDHINKNQFNIVHSANYIQSIQQ